MLNSIFIIIKIPVNFYSPSTSLLQFHLSPLDCHDRPLQRPTLTPTILPQLLLTKVRLTSFKSCWTVTEYSQILSRLGRELIAWPFATTSLCCSPTKLVRSLLAFHTSSQCILIQITMPELWIVALVTWTRATRNDFIQFGSILYTHFTSITHTDLVPSIVAVKLV